MKSGNSKSFVYNWKNLHSFRRFKSTPPTSSSRRRKGNASSGSNPPPSSSSSLLQSISTIISPSSTEHRLEDARRIAPQKVKPLNPAAADKATSIVRSGIIEENLGNSSLDTTANLAEHRLREAPRIAPPEIKDISPAVAKVTSIVRSGIIDENLGVSALELTVDLAEMVLKRCFKDKDAAIKFFSWCRRQLGFRHSTATYNTMLYIAGEARDFELVDSLLRWMEEDSCAPNLKTWTILIQKFGRGRKIGRALSIFEKMKKLGYVPDNVAYSVMIKSFCEVGKVEMAVEFYKEMISSGGFVPDKDLYKVLMGSLAQLGDLDAVAFIEEELGKNSKGDDLRLKSMCISGRIDEVMVEMRTKELDLSTIEIVVTGLAKAGRVSEAVEFVAEAEERGFPCNGKILGQIVSGFLRVRDLISAREFYCKMKEHGFFPEMKISTEMIQHLSRAGEIDAACEVFDKVLQRGEEMDSVVIVAMAAGYVQHGRVAEAMELMERMKKKGMKFSTKSCFVLKKELSKISSAAGFLREKVVGEKGMGEKAGFLREEVEGEKGMREKAASEEMCPVVAAPLREKVGEREFHEVKMVEKILGSSEDWDSMAEELKNNGISFSPEMAELVLRRCRRHGGAALRFFTWVERTAGITHTVSSYHLAMKIAGAGKDFSFMRHLHEEMKRKGHPRNSDTWTIMIGRYGRAGLTKMALKKFAEMKEEGFSPNASTFKFLILSLCGRKGRDLEKARNLFEQMLQKGFSPDQEVTEIFLACLCEDGKVNDAKTCVDSLTKEGVLTSWMCQSLLVKALSRGGRVEEAMKLAGQSQRVDRFVYVNLVNGLLRAGRETEALTKIEEMKGAGFRSSVHVYTSLMAYFFKEKRPDEALKVLEKMKREGLELTLVTCSVLICGYIHAGMIKDAWDLFGKMVKEGPKPDFRVYSMFMEALTKVGKSDEAVTLIDEMANKGIFPSAVNFRAVVFGLNREGKHSLARELMKRKWELNKKRKFLC